MSYAALKTLRPFFTDRCGRLLSGGKVYTYEAGSLTLKPTYKDSAGLTENTNPIVLDASGEADIYINSDYRFQIFDRNGTLIDDVDSVAQTQRISSAFLIDSSGLTQEQINATKEDSINKGVAGGYASLDENSKIPVGQLHEASTTQKGIVQLVNDLTTGGIGKALTAEQGKLLFSMFANSKTTSGYQKLPGGLIIQWQTVSVTAADGVFQTFSYPITFPNACLASAAMDAGSAPSDVAAYKSYILSTSQFQILKAKVIGTITTRNAHLIHIGY